jgi:hypothetical protein
MKHGARWALELVFEREKSFVPVRNTNVSKCNTEKFCEKNILDSF